MEKKQHTTSGQLPPPPLLKCQVANETHGVHGKKLDCGEGEGGGECEEGEGLLSLSFDCRSDGDLVGKWRMSGQEMRDE